MLCPRCVGADKCLLHGRSKSGRQRALGHCTRSRDSQWLKVGPSDRERFVSGSTSRLSASPKRWLGDQVTTFRQSSRTIWRERSGCLGPGCSRPFRPHCCWLRYLVPVSGVRSTNEVDQACLSPPTLFSPRVLSVFRSAQASRPWCWLGP